MKIVESYYYSSSIQLLI